MIEITLRQLIDEVKFWNQHKAYEPENIAVSFHHCIVAIHRF